MTEEAPAEKKSPEDFCGEAKWWTIGNTEIKLECDLRHGHRSDHRTRFNSGTVVYWNKP